MFSNIGWLEILLVLIIAFFVIGPERLPGLIKDVRATILAFRNLVADARRQLDENLGDEMQEFRKPLEELNKARQMGARGFITKTLLDDDDSFLTSLDNSAKDIRSSVTSVTDSVTRRPPRGPVVAQQADAGESRDTYRGEHEVSRGRTGTDTTGSDAPAPTDNRNSTPPKAPVDPFSDVL